MSEQAILFLLASYLLGSIPTGFLIVITVGRKDIRTLGSGNIGATNVLRSQGRLAAFLTLLCDILKGALPILYAQGKFDSPTLIFAGGVAAICGHIFPVFLKFRGGKGISPMLGVLAVFYWPALLTFLALFLPCLWRWHYVSLASLAGTGAALLTLLPTHPLLIWQVLAVATLVFTRHHANIARLLAGTENSIKSRVPDA